MSSRKAILAGLCALAALSCTREFPDPVTSPATVAGEAGPAVVAEPSQQQARASFVPGAAIVYTSEQLADQLGDGLSGDKLKKSTEDLGYMASRLGAKSFTRLFPDAGEYELRTRREGLHRWFLVEFDPSTSFSDAKPLLEAVTGIQRVEPNYVLKRAVSINDPDWSSMWGQNNTAYPGYDVNCKPVWDNYTMGDPKVVVAVVDGGIQLNHPDLAYNVASTGHYNYIHHNTTIKAHEHGTHVAGTIAAVNNNGVGVTGVAGGNSAAGKPGVKLLSLQVFETQDNGQDISASSFSTALKEAADKGAHISQNSWGYYFDFNDDGQITGYELTMARESHENPERSFTQAVDYFNKYAGCDNYGNQLSNSPMKGGVVIFAAGNENIPYGAPGNYDGCVSVGAMNKNGSKASFSNYGDWVDVCAPGVNIKSTCIPSKYATFSGTSMACPHASGVAALIASYFGGKGFTADELRARLIGGARQIAASTGSKAIGPLVDAWGSFNMNGTSSVAPDKVTSIEAAPVGHNIKVDFSATNAYAYMALTSTQKSALQNADPGDLPSNVVSATRLASSSDVEGTQLSIHLAGLKPSTDYYVAVVAYSYDKKYSPLSDILEIHTADNLKPEITITDYPEDGFEFHHHEVVTIPVSFSDPDGDAISVTFDPKGSRATMESNNGSEGLYNFKLMCPLVLNPGQFTGVIKVTDEVGATTIRTIQFKVLPNTAPEQVADMPILLLKEAKEEKSLSLTDYFRDPDEEPLTFRAISSDESVATVRVEDGILYVKARKEGLCDVKVIAEDHDGAKATVVVTVLMRPEGSPEVLIKGDSVVSDHGSVTIIPGVEPDTASVRVISASGVVVYETVCIISAANPLEIKLDNLAPGVYTMEVTYKGELYTYTIVKR